MMNNDIALVIKDDIFGNTFDMKVTSNDIALEDGLRTAVIVSLFSDARAEVEDDPDLQGDRRGWWGDMLSQIQGDHTGSKLWLLDRSKQTQETLTRAEQYAEESLQWMLDDGVASKVKAVADAPQPGFLRLVVSITRPNGNIINYTFDNAWKAEGAK